MKKIIIFIITLLTTYTFVLANDCNIVASVTRNTDGNFAVLENWKYEHILPVPAINRSMLNLKSFCCKEELLNESDCRQDSTIDMDGNFPSSAYLYDHILDVSMRRLDAKTKNDNGEDLIYNLEPDTAGLEWRDFITKHGNNKDGSVPLDISNKFKENRTADNNILVSWNANYASLPWNDDKFENYNERRLVNKYMGICETSIYLYLNMPINVDIAQLGKAYGKCEIMSNNRINNEVKYTKAILMQKGNKLLYNNVQSYLSNYFSQNKLVALQQVIFNIKNIFNEINKAIPKLVNTCS